MEKRNLEVTTSVNIHARNLKDFFKGLLGRISSAAS
jgi:hypothetical protein